MSIIAFIHVATAVNNNQLGHHLPVVVDRINKIKEKPRTNRFQLKCDGRTDADEFISKERIE